MRMTEEGLALIRRFEGLRTDAYRDAVGVWTIGFGHTSMAGPPEVTPGLSISREEASAILARDVEKFAAGVCEAVTVPLNDAQFSALVSFAYNVGLGALRGSSVLKAVNAGDFAEVPRRLALWVKAGGRTLPGLVKRRAAEGKLFASDVSTPEVSLPPPAHNNTLWLVIAAALAALFEYFRKTKKEEL
jgi:lysozyme